MIEIKLAIIAICAVLKMIGELWYHNAQRFILPLILGAGLSYVTHTWWMGLTTLLVIGILVQGYGEKSILYRYLSDAGARGMWLFLATLTIGAGPFFSHHLYWFLYVPYTVLAGIFASTTRNLNNIPISLLTGAYLGLILFLCH